MQKMPWTFSAHCCVLRERMGSIVLGIVRTFTLMVLFTQFPLCRTLVLVFHVLRYTNNV